MPSKKTVYERPNGLEDHMQGNLHRPRVRAGMAAGGVLSVSLNMRVVGHGSRCESITKAMK